MRYNADDVGSVISRPKCRSKDSGDLHCFSVLYVFVEQDDNPVAESSPVFFFSFSLSVSNDRVRH